MAPAAAQDPTPRSGASPLRAHAARALDSTADFLRLVVEKADEDRIFFMAGAIAFNVLVGLVPLLLAAVGIGATLLRLQHADPTAPVLDALRRSLPPVSPEFERWVQDLLRGILEQSTGLLGIGTLVLAWIATRLIATLRTVLREIFDIQEERGIIAGKLFDLQMVLAAGTLLALNVAATLALDILAAFGNDLLGPVPRLRAVDLLYGRLVGFASIWILFLLMYRYLPARRVHWPTALVAATVAALLFELLKAAFGWYVTRIANFRSTYGNLATLMILILWIYYSAIAFVLGGETAQVAALRRIRRRQKERLT